MTAEEFALRLRFGGVTSCLDTKLVAKALLYGVRSRHESLFFRPRERIPGVDGRHATYRWDNSDSTASPKSQRTRTDRRGNTKEYASPPTIVTGYFTRSRTADGPIYRHHLDTIAAYYDSISLLPPSTVPTPSSPAARPVASAVSVTPASAMPDAAPNSPPHDDRRRGYQIVDSDLLDAFMDTLFQHHSHCPHGNRNTKLVRLKLKKIGYCSSLVYQCSGCKCIFVHRTSRDIKSAVMVPGTKFSRTQPEINLLMSSAASNAAIWPDALFQTMAEVGVQCPTKRNITVAEKKVRVAVDEVAEECMQANRRKENKLATDRIEYISADGITRSAAVVEASHDGMGPKRFINNRCTGTAHIAVTMGVKTGLPLCIPCDLISCVGCNRKFTQELKKAKEKGEEILPANINLRHNGKCYRNSRHSPAVAEEFALERVGIDLLNNPDGTARGDGEALFIGNNVTDGDSKGAHRLVVSQSKIVGNAATGKADGCGDWGHNKKNMKKEWYKMAKDNHLGGVQMLTSHRITSMSSDVEGAVRRYKRKVIDVDEIAPAAKKKCLDTLMTELDAVVDHHCGIHENCTGDMCKMVKLDEENPTWSDQKLREEYAKQARYGGRFMLVSKAGRATLKKAISKRITRKGADRVALMKSTNPNESMNGVHAKYTHGKRINTTQTDAYQFIMHRVVGQKTLQRCFSPTVNSKLGAVAENTIQRANLNVVQKRKDDDKERKNMDVYKERRSHGKLFRDCRTEKQTKKADQPRRYIPEKCGPSSSCALKTKQAAKPPCPPTCKNSWCGMVGHTKSQCQMPPPEGQKVQLTKKQQKLVHQAEADVDEWFSVL